jgi:hypothetical protein
MSRDGNRTVTARIAGGDACLGPPVNALGEGPLGLLPPTCNRWARGRGCQGTGESRIINGGPHSDWGEGLHIAYTHPRKTRTAATGMRDRQLEARHLRRE